ncbi:peptidoglycan-binding protein [Nodosilinea sp. LEGE 07088]|uniref:peptidoglycan-binding protein n=1 Tax=Nodosilinea sp. LEGE 07088 TaxID=2777968 RepID=UPI00187E72BE|nr:peptidoglycan-binding protein [Nodosilinea sp. LEGE 07088]MBE9141402.1 peptidoglycan-binding protein [Nodosilinea sp. LEGE 07088]
MTFYAEEKMYNQDASFANPDSPLTDLGVSFNMSCLDDLSQISRSDPGQLNTLANSIETEVYSPYSVIESLNQPLDSVFNGFRSPKNSVSMPQQPVELDSLDPLTGATSTLLPEGIWEESFDVSSRFDRDVSVLEQDSLPYPGYLFRYIEGQTLTRDENVETWQRQMRERGWQLAVDGFYGPESEGIARQFQQAKDLAVDGIVGPNTWRETFDTGSPPFPGELFIYESGRINYNPAVKQWQQRMKDVGWTLSVDGYYGPQSADIARQFQAAEGFTLVDGIVGPQTWEASFDDQAATPNDVPPVAPPPTDGSDYTTLVPIPPDSEMNQGLTSPSVGGDEYMLNLLGDPENPSFDLVTEDVGPFTATGLKPAVEALTNIFEKVEQEKPELYEQLGYLGMLNVRKIAGTTTWSNHAWGAAIDIQIGNTEADLDRDGQTYRGLVELYPYFEDAGFYWGAEFSTNEDPIHFEASRELLEEWRRAGLLT